MTCRWNGTQHPRTIPGRHNPACDDETCRGCQPCTQAHCRLCGVNHHDGTCPDCLAETRDNLHQIAEACGAMPTEVRHRGINGEAMVILGPATDPERLQHVEASYLAGRLPEGWLETSHGRGCPTLVNEPCLGCAGSEHHPVIVLLGWQLVWRDALEHDEAPDSTLATAIDYLDRTMTYMGGYEHVPFEDFARDIRGCAGHLATVLHDQAHGDRANVGCFVCGGDLERKLTDRDGFEDWWTCIRCRRRYTVAEYNFALRASLEDATREAG